MASDPAAAPSPSSTGSEERSFMGQMWPFLRPYAHYLVLGALCIGVSSWVNVEVPGLIGKIIDILKAQGQAAAGEVRHLALLIVGLTALGGLGRFLMRIYMIGSSRRIERDLRNFFYDRLLGLSATFYDTERTGDVMERASSDIEGIRMWIGPGIMHSCSTAILLPFAIWKLTQMSLGLTLMAVVPFVILATGVKFFGDRIYQRSRAAQDQLSVMGATVQEAFAGIRVVKAFRQEGPQLDLFSDVNGELITRNLALARIRAGFMPFMMTMGSMAFLVTLWGGSFLIINGGANVLGMHFEPITVGDLISFVLILGLLVWPTIALGWSVSLYQRGRACMARVARVTSAMPMVIDTATGEGLPELLGADIATTKLSFAYPNPPSIAGWARDGKGREREAPKEREHDELGPVVLRDIDLRLAAGKTLGVVGRIGSGKSTLGRLLARFYPVERGMLRLGGVDINDIPFDRLRRHVGYVFQETFLFSDSIMENIRFGRPDATDDEVIEACKTASLHSDIMEFPKGYETMLGERGINLSGGQKQRAAIARALIYNPQVLVLDDALSAVDTETEEAILRELRRANAERTVVIIAHRLSTLKNADNIIVLESGSVVEEGRHEKLAAGEGLYAQLWRDQQLEAEIAGSL